MVQTLINEVRQLGTEQNNNVQEIQRLGAEQFLPTPAREEHALQLLQDAESSTRELGSRLCFQVTRTRGVTGISSCVPPCQWLTSNLAD